MSIKQKFSKKRGAPADDYESDGGFVEDAPQSKKMKAAQGKAQVNTTTQEDEEGNVYWELSGKRRLQVSNFKGNTFVGVREFYEKDGKMLPGKKGIALSIDQYTGFLELLPQIEAVLKDKGIDVPRPKYDGKASVESVKGGSVAEEDDDDEEVDDKPARTLDKYKLDKKKNHEATSDEEDDGDE